MKILLAASLATSMLLAQAPHPAPQVPTPTPTPSGEQPAGSESKPQQTPAPQSGTPAPSDKPQGDKPQGDKQGDKPKSGTPANGAPAGQQPADQGNDATKAPSGPVPRGSDPADLAAIRSAEAMVQAERKLQQMIKDGKVTGLDKVVTFDELSAWPYEDGLKGMPRRVKELDGKKVLMSGFMLPIDEVQNIKEFLLVQSLWSCCYGQPPDINGIVRVVMPKGKTTDYFFDPLKVIGRFKVEATVIDGYCVDIYQLEVESIETLKDK
jgi:hypothetical protein